MSRKLLKEETVSKFMKLANINGDRRQHFLKENFVAEAELEEKQEELEEADLGSELEEAALDEIDIGELEEEAFGLEEAEEDEDLPADEDEDVGSLEMSAEEARDAISALTVVLDKLQAAVGEGPEEEPMALEPEEEPEEVAAEPELEPEPEEEAEERGGMGGMYEGKEAQEELVNKIAKRVAARLLKESKK